MGNDCVQVIVAHERCISSSFVRNIFILFYTNIKHFLFSAAKRIQKKSKRSIISLMYRLEGNVFYFNRIGDAHSKVLYF